MTRHAPTVAVSLAALAATACEARFEGPAPQLSRVEEPVALAPSQDGCSVFLANGNFDLKERGAGVVVIDVTDRRVLPGAGVEIGSFPAQMRLHPNGRRLYATVRGDDSITWIDVGDADADGRPDLSCGEGGPGGRCGDERKLRMRREAGSSLLVTEPLGLELTCDRRGGGCATPEGGELGLISTWLRSGVVAYFPLDGEGVPLEVDEVGIRLVQEEQQQEGVTISGVAGLAMAPEGGSGYVTSFANDRLRTFRIEARGADSVVRLDESQRIVGGTHDNRSTEMRGVAVTPGGQRLFLASRHPTINRRDPMQIYAVEAPTDGTGAPDFQVSAAIRVSGTPGLLRMLPGDSTTNPPRPDLLYAVIFGGARIAVIDALRLDVIDVIDVGSGPFDLAFVTPAADARCATTDEGRPRREAWVTEFMDDSVAIIDIDPESPTYHQVVAHVR